MAASNCENEEPSICQAASICVKTWLSEASIYGASFAMMKQLIFGRLILRHQATSVFNAAKIFGSASIFEWASFESKPQFNGVCKKTRP